MTKSEIVRMAYDAGCKSIIVPEEWFRFANLVAAAEREAIARMIEDSPPLVSFAQNDRGGCLTCGFTPKLAALTIRERGAP